jgi:hypothetical protein
LNNNNNNNNNNNLCLNNTSIVFKDLPPRKIKILPPKRRQHRPRENGVTSQEWELILGFLFQVLGMEKY